MKETEILILRGGGGMNERVTCVGVNRMRERDSDIAYYDMNGMHRVAKSARQNEKMQFCAIIHNYVDNWRRRRDTCRVTSTQLE